MVADEVSLQSRPVIQHRLESGRDSRLERVKYMLTCLVASCKVGSHCMLELTDSEGFHSCHGSMMTDALIFHVTTYYDFEFRYLYTMETLYSGNLN